MFMILIALFGQLECKLSFALDEKRFPLIRKRIEPKVSSAL
jgi:hypothetical protein